MALGVYKPDQGYWTRLMSTIAIGVIALAGAAWLWNELSVLQVDRPEYYQGAGVLILLGLMGYFTYWLYWRKRETVEFFIATEGEMKKVNWSTRREVIGSTWVVVIVAVFIASLLFVVDIFFAEAFKLLGVVYGESSVAQFFRWLFGGGG